MTSGDQDNAAVFSTPEDAIAWYIEGLAQADTDRILQACAVEEISQNFRLDEYSEWVGSFATSMYSHSDYPFWAQIGRAEVSATVLRQVKMLAYSLLSSERLGEDGAVFLGDEAEETMGGFIRDIDPARLSGLEVEMIAPADRASMSGQRYLDYVTEAARCYGADEATDRVALLSIEGKYYYAGFYLLRYGANWKIAGSSSLVNTEPPGWAQETTVEEFEEEFGNGGS